MIVDNLIEFNKIKKEVPIKEEPMKYNGITIFKNKKCNSWYARYRLNGRQNYISGKTQKNVYNKLKNIFKKEEQQKNLTFKNWYKTWIDVYKKEKVKQTTIVEYEVQMKHLSDNFKNKELNLIKPIQIENELNNIPNARAKQKLFEFLKQIFKKAQDNDLLKTNPTVNIDKPKYVRDRGQILEKEDYIKFEQYCIDNNYNCILFILYQGLRIGEALALTNEDVNLEQKTININKSFNQKNEIDTTKNKQSIRTMPLFEKSVKLINIKPGRIFEYSQKHLQKQLLKIKQDLKLNEKLRIHDLRHTFISLCKNENIPEHIIQSWVGHEFGSKVTSKIYTHINKEANLLYYNKLNNSQFYSNSTQNFNKNEKDTK